MFRILKNFGCACGCGVMLYFWLVWMFKPEGPLHHAYVITTIEENRQKLTEGWRSLQEINPLRDALKFEPDEGVFDLEDREDVGDTSAENQQTESAEEQSTGSERETEEGGTSSPSSARSSDASKFIFPEEAEAVSGESRSLLEDLSGSDEGTQRERTRTEL